MLPEPGEGSLGTGVQGHFSPQMEMDGQLDAHGVTWGFFPALVLNECCVAFRCWEGPRL